MKIDAKKIVKTVAKAGFYVISRAVGFGLLGLVVNILLLVFLRSEMAAVIKMTPGGGMAEAGGSGVIAIIFIFVLMIAYWPITLMIVGFGIVFPVLYFLKGKQHGIQKAIQYIVGDNRDFIMEYTVDRLIAHVKKATGVADKVDATISKSRLLELLPAFLKKMDTMPRPMRMVFRLLYRKVDLGGILTRIVQEQQGGDDAQINFDLLAQIAKEKAADKLEEKLLAPSLTWFAILGGVNLGIFIVLKIVL